MTPPSQSGQEDRPDQSNSHAATVSSPRKKHGMGAVRDTGPSKPRGFLGLVLRAGNLLPDPFWLFVILAGVVLVASWIGSAVGMRAENPSTGEIIEVQNLLTGEGFREMIANAIDNFLSFPPLGVILVVMLGIAVAEHAGLISACMRGAIARTKRAWLLTFIIALTAVTGSIASDAVYVIVIPLGAAAYKAIGRSPIAGGMVAFAASSGGFNASLLLNITDVLLAGISTEAAHFVDENYNVNPLANYFFVIPSAILLSIIITLVAELFMNRRTHELIDHSTVDYDAANFDNASIKKGDDEQAGREDVLAGTEYDEDEEDDSDLPKDLRAQPQEVAGMKASAVALAILLIGFFVGLFAPFSPLQGEGGAVMESVLIDNIAVVIGVMFLIVGITYGLVAGTITQSRDIPDFMVEGLKTLLPMMVLFFAVSQFLAYFEWSQLGQWTAIRGSELLTAIDLPTPILFFLFAVLVFLINLLITSGSAQWALMAPVVVPMFMLVGIAPEVTQMIYRIGDSTANIVTPMSPYFALALTLLQRYHKKMGVGTLMSLSIPFALSMFIGWFLFFLGWWGVGLPLGPGN